VYVNKEKKTIWFLTNLQDLIYTCRPSTNNQTIPLLSNKYSSLSSCSRRIECFALCYSYTHLICLPLFTSAAICLSVVSLMGNMPLVLVLQWLLRCSVQDQNHVISTSGHMVPLKDEAVRSRRVWLWSIWRKILPSLIVLCGTWDPLLCRSYSSIAYTEVDAYCCRQWDVDTPLLSGVHC
jgi:hypothetical protein